MPHWTLDNGLDLLGVAVPESPLVAVRLAVRVGSACEPPEEAGTAHVVEHLLLRRRFAAGYMVDAWTARDVTVFRSVVPSAMAVTATMALLDTVLTLDVDGTALREELLTIRQERARRENDPAWRLRERLLAALWRGTPYGRPVLGDEAVLTGLDRARVRRFHRVWYAPANAVLVMAGDTADHRVAREVASLAAALPHGAEPPVAAPPAPPPPTAAAAAVVATAGRAGYGTTVGVAFGEELAGERDRVRHDLARQVVRAAGGIVAHRIPAGGRDGATWLAVVRRGGPPAPAAGDVVAGLRVAERVLRDRDRGQAVVTEARIAEVRDAERLDEVAARAVDRWIRDRAEYDPAHHHLCLDRLRTTDVAEVVRRFRLAAARAVPVPVPVRPARGPSA